MNGINHFMAEFTLDDINNAKYIFSKSITNINTNHNQAIDVYNSVLAQFPGFKEKKPALINFDLHSDIYINFSGNPQKHVNWINYLILKENIREIYWVIPDFIVENEKYKKNFETIKTFELPYFRPTNADLNKLNEFTLYIDKELQEIHTLEKINFVNSKCKKFDINPLYSTEGKELLKVYVCTAKSLPNLKNQYIFLSVDADYFCNNGFDTLNNISNIPSELQLRENFSKFINILKEKEITANLISLSKSPQYCPENLLKAVEKFFELIEENSQYKLIV